MKEDAIVTPATNWRDPVTQFAIDHSIAELVDQGLSLLPRMFTFDGNAHLSLEHDPDEEVSWLQINGTVVGEPDEVAAATSQFRRELARLAPTAERSLLRLCLGVRSE